MPVDDIREGVGIRAQRHYVASTFNPTSMLRASLRSQRSLRLNYWHLHKVRAWFGEVGADTEVVIYEGWVAVLLLCDLVLPGGLNGVELAQEVTRRRPNTRIIFMSAIRMPLQ